MILLLLELGFLAMAGYTLSIRWGNTPAESGAYALFLPLVGLTIGVDVALLLDVPLIGWIWEGFLAVTAITILIRTRPTIGTVWSPVSQEIKAHPVAASAFGLIYLAFFIALFSGSPNPLGLFVEISPNNPFRIALPGNIQALAYWLVRAHGPTAPILVALMAFGAITFATYALARRYAWPPTAMTVTLMVISMPRLACLVSAGSTEIIHTAGCLLGLLSLYRLVERPYGRDFFLLLMTLGFSVSMAWLQWLYPMMIVPLAIILMLRRHGAFFFKAIVTRQNFLAALCLIPTALFVFYPLLTRSMAQMSTIDSGWRLPLNPNGMQGALANGIRYLMEAIHLTLPVDQLVHALTSTRLTGLLQQFYTDVLSPLVGNHGAVAPFQIHWAPTIQQGLVWTLWFFGHPTGSVVCVAKGTPAAQGRGRQPGMLFLPDDLDTGLEAR